VFNVLVLVHRLHTHDAELSESGARTEAPAMKGTSMAELLVENLEALEPTVDGLVASSNLLVHQEHPWVDGRVGVDDNAGFVVSAVGMNHLLLPEQRHEAVSEDGDVGEYTREERAVDPKNAPGDDACGDFVA